jgi:hypothetical protein
MMIVITRPIQGNIENGSVSRNSGVRIIRIYSTGRGSVNDAPCGVNGHGMYFFPRLRTRNHNSLPDEPYPVKWEYRQFEVKSADFWAWQGNIPESAIMDLNRLVSEGWELVTAVPLCTGQRPDGLCLVYPPERDGMRG